MATPQEDSRDSDAPSNPGVTPGPWPSETDIIFLPGSNKVLLTVQRPLLRAVIQDAFDRIRASLLFENAFPKVQDAMEMIKENLMEAAKANDRAIYIRSRLLFDDDYINDMCRLVSL